MKPQTLSASFLDGPTEITSNMKKDEPKIYISFAIVIVFFVLLFFIPQKHNLEDIKGIKIAGQNIKVELALSREELMQGLSGRLSLNADEGMLFIFPQPGNYTFWMKDMNFPIDMIWLSQNKKVIYIKKDARPEFFPESYGPEANSKYILEVVSGFSERYNLQVGDRVEFQY